MEMTDHDMQPYAGNQHVRFDEGEVAPAAKPRRGFYSTFGGATIRNYLYVLLPFIAVVTSAFGATDIYVAADGDDANDGLTPATAKATIAGGYDALTNGLPEATYGNRLVIGEGTFNLPSVTTVLSNGWKIVGEGRDKTTLTVTAKTNQFDLASADTELRDFKINFVGSSMDMRKYGGNGADLLGAFALNPKGTFSDLDVVNYYTSWGGTLLHITAAGVSPVVTNCVFRNFRITYRQPLIMANDQHSSLLLTHCSFIDGSCGSYWTPGTISMASGNGSRVAVTIRNCLFLRCKNYQDCHSGHYPTGTISANDKAKIENCSIVDCTFVGPAFSNEDSTWRDLCGPIVKCAAGVKTGATVVNTLVYNCTNLNGELQPCRDGAYSYCANDAALLAGEGNIQVAPGSINFQNAREDRLIPVDGPTVNAATTLPWLSGSTDIRGKARINGSAADIGCWEYYAPNVYYMSVDGDDANDGLTPSTAKATIGAAVSLLSDIDEKVIVGDGSFALPGETLVLSNGWAIESVNGPEATRLYATDASHSLFALATPGATLRGLKIDFCNLSFSTPATQCSLVRAPRGCVENCIVERFYYNGYDQNAMASIVRVEGSSAAPVFSNVVFRNSYTVYRSAFVNVYDESAPIFLDCTFSDLEVGNYYSYGIVYVENSSSKPQFRNCLFLRCSANQAVHRDKYRTAIVNFQKQTAAANVDNCTFLDCRFFGTGFRTNDTTWATSCGPVIRGGNVRNCLFVNCTNELSQTQFASWATGTKPVWSHCAAETALDGDGNILVSAANMRYRSKRRGDYTIIDGPTIDAGESLPWHSGATDLYGRNRVIGSAVDIGCGEFDPFELPGLQLILK